MIFYEFEKLKYSIMTIEEHIKKVMAECPLTKQQEEKLILGLENYLDEIEQVKKLNIPDVVGRSEQLFCRDCTYLDAESEHDIMWCKDCRQRDRFKAK